MFDAKNFHPLQGYRFLLRITLTKQADRIEKAGTDNIQGRDILFIILSASPAIHIRYAS